MEKNYENNKRKTDTNKSSEEDLITISAFATEKKEEKETHAVNHSNGRRSSEFSYSSKKEDEALEKKKSLETIGFRSEVSPNAFLTNFYSTKNFDDQNSKNVNLLNKFENKNDNSDENYCQQFKNEVKDSKTDFINEKAKDITNEFFDFSIKGKFLFYF